MGGEAGFLSFACQALVGVDRSPAPHHLLMIAQLEDIAAGCSDRLMIQMPPGSAKSTYGSILFPAYFLSRHPTAQIIGTAHTASLADYFGRHVRNVVIEHGETLGVSLAKASRASARFAVTEGGEYFAAGVRGPITGRRGDLILIDDPIKSWAEAESPRFRNALYDWYRAELTARLKPEGRIVLMMTRWHEDDLAGRLMRTESGWKTLVLPALAEANDVMGRPEGAALWPEWEDEKAIARRRRDVGERAFAALYQQRPRPPDLAMFNTKTIRILAEAPQVVRSIRAWDLAATAEAAGRDADYTVGLKLGVTSESKLVVLDVIRMRVSPAQVEARILVVAKADGPRTVIALPQDPGQAGVAQVALLSRTLVGFTVDASPEKGAKIIRARAAATQVDAGNVLLVAAPWNDAFLAELSAFPDSAKDDQVDALARAVNTLATTTATAARRVDVPLLLR